MATFALLTWLFGNPVTFVTLLRETIVLCFGACLMDAGVKAWRKRSQRPTVDQEAGSAAYVSME